MSFLEALILGIIQGLTEFLPVSSSGHLELAKAIQGQEISAESSMMMTVTVHAATALSTIVVFRKDILQIFKGLFQFKANEELYFSLKVILSMIPAAIVGLFFNDIIEGWFDGEVLLVGSMLLVTGVLLILADKAKDSAKSVGFGHAIVIGIAQAIAILPGISRSGATIGTSVLLGIDRSKAARFSFLMVVPLILGKMADDLRKGDVVTNDVPASMLIVGFIAAFITGILACTWMVGLVKRSKLSWFAYYCFLVGTGSVLWYFLA